MDDVVGDAVALAARIATRSSASGGVLGERPQQLAQSSAERSTLRPPPRASLARVVSTGARSRLICEDYGYPPASGISSRVLHDSITTSQPARALPRRGCVPVAAAADNASTLYAGELEIRLGEGLVLATGRALTLSVREFELLAAMARRAGAIVSRDELYARGVGRGAARGRPLGRRVREQAARQARDGDARPSLHPHPPRLRLPLPATARARGLGCGERGDELRGRARRRRGLRTVPTGRFHEMFTSGRSATRETARSQLTGRRRSLRVRADARGPVTQHTQPSQRERLSVIQAEDWRARRRRRARARPRRLRQLLKQLQLVDARATPAPRSPAPARRSPPRSTSSGPRRCRP